MGVLAPNENSSCATLRGGNGLVWTFHIMTSGRRLGPRAVQTHISQWQCTQSPVMVLVDDVCIKYCTCTLYIDLSGIGMCPNSVM